MLSLHEKNNIYMFFCTEYGLTNLQEDIQSIASSAFIQVLIMHTVTQVSCLLPITCMWTLQVMFSIRKKIQLLCKDLTRHGTRNNFIMLIHFFSFISSICTYVPIIRSIYMNVDKYLL